MLWFTDQKVERNILAVDPEAKVEEVLYVVIHNGFHQKDRIFWQRVRRILFWSLVGVFLLSALWSRVEMSPYVPGIMGGLVGASIMTIHDTGFVLKDHRGYRLYLHNKGQWKIKEVIPLPLEEITTYTSVEEVSRKVSLEVELSFRDEYYKLLVNRKSLGLKKQRTSFEPLLQGLLEETKSEESVFSPRGLPKKPKA